VKSCPKCHATYADTVKFCPGDGSALELRIGPVPDPRPAKSHRCPACGTSYAAGRFCITDGALLEPVA
jgi:hypothetical protein